MKIAIWNAFRARVGGVERYLETVIPALEAAGHAISFWFEQGSAPGVESIRLPKSVTACQIRENGNGGELSIWQPDVLYAHSPLRPGGSHNMAAVAPVVFFAHNYYGTCVSGLKRHDFPVTRPCSKRFSAACLAHYFPRRCGGLNPVTMVRHYHREAEVLEQMRSYEAIVVASRHMATEYERHGFGERVHVVGLPVEGPTDPVAERLAPAEGEPVRLLFIGRMESYKGGLTLLDALPDVRARLGRKVHVIFAGDGRERDRWQTHSNAIMQRVAGVEVKFAGWLTGEKLSNAMKESHLLVIPSLWPEPFGLVGLEAGGHGVPTVAFNVGGISDWLKDGVNGHLASGDPPTSQGLCEAIARCSSSDEHYVELRRGARRALKDFTLDQHIGRLQSVFEKAA